MKTYSVVITGKTPMLHHYDNISWAEEMRKWREVPENKKRSTPGDDRTPAFTWLGSLYHDGQRVAVPSDNLMRCLMDGGASVLVPGGKRGKTFKAQTQSGMLVREEFYPLLVDGKEVPFAPIAALKSVLDFDEHVRAVSAMGFSLFVKRARIGTSKHVRVRPRFNRWELRATVDVWDEQITGDALRDILRVAGEYKGLGDWRPSGHTPGPFGRFSATITEAKGD